MHLSTDLSGKVALITGGCIGAAIARRFSQDGASVTKRLQLVGGEGARFS